MHWTDWLMVIACGAVMLAMLAAAACMLEWMVGMMGAIAAR